MPAHYWGDEWFEEHGENLDAAIRFCMTNWKRWGRIGSHGKEKYGTFRHHCYFFFNYEPMQELLYPGYVRLMLPSWLREVDTKIMSHLFKYTRLASLIRYWQVRIVYNLVLQIACWRWPQIIDEIMSDCEAPRAVRLPFGLGVDGIEIRNKYWFPKMRRDGTLIKEKVHEED